MKSRKILRPKQTWASLGCGKTKFETDYRFHSADDPFVPGTNIRRLKPIKLGERNVGFLEHELDALIEALAEAGGHSESKAKNRKAAPRQRQRRNGGSANHDRRVDADRGRNRGGRGRDRSDRDGDVDQEPMAMTEKPRPPDLQELVARFGGYNKITPEAWAEYDRQMAEYHTKRREVLARERAESLKPKE
jgi:hypothetical protein